MTAINTGAWETLERRCPTAFFVAGALVFGHAAIQGARAFTDAAAPIDVFAPAGHFVALLGLIGLARRAAERNRTFARGATVAVSIPAAGWAVISVSQFGRATALLAPHVPTLPDVVPLLVVATTILAYVIFGVAITRAYDDSRSIGLLLFAPAVLFFALIASVAAVGASATVGFVVGSGLALTNLAIGYVLRTRTGRSARVVTATDAAA